MNDNLLKLNGDLILKKGTEQEFIHAFSEFLKSKDVEFSGNIGSDMIRIGNVMPEIPVNSLNLSQRVKKILYGEGIFDLSVFRTYYEEDITGIYGLGPTGYKELLPVLEEHGIHPISFTKETMDFKYFYKWERKELLKNNIRTSEDIFALSETEIATMFTYGSRLYNKLIRFRKKHVSDTDKREEK